MAELKALIFDVDGTLANTEEGHRRAFNETFPECGLDWAWDAALYGELLKISGGKERMRFYLDEYAPAFPAVSDLDAFFAEVHRRKTRRYGQLVEAGEIELRPGVRRLLEEARAAGLRLAVATTTSLENVTTLLARCIAPEAVDWFEVIGAGNMVPAKKPAPDIYFYVLKALGLVAEHCLAFEDSANGVRAARGADLKVLVTVCDYTRQDDFSGASLVLDHLGEADRPCSVLAGDAGGARYVDLALLRRVHGGAV